MAYDPILALGAVASVESNKQRLRRSADAWNAGDLDRYLSIYAPEIAHHGLDPRGPLDAAQNRASYQVTYAAFAGSQLTVQHVVGEADWLSSRFRLDGVHGGEFMGIAETGRRVVLEGQNMMRFADGLVVERWTIADVVGLLHQLGARIGH